MLKKYFLLLMGLSLTTSGLALHTQVGRYLSVPNQPLPEQRNLMRQIIEVKFPPQVKTVGQALQYLLKPSGYTLATPEAHEAAVKKMLQFNLPLVDRHFGPMPLETALKTLAGESFVLHVDRLNREVAFHLNPNQSHQ